VKTSLGYIGTTWQANVIHGKLVPHSHQSFCTVGTRPTQPSTLSGMENEYGTKCGKALQLGIKVGMVHSTCG